MDIRCALVDAATCNDKCASVSRVCSTETIASPTSAKATRTVAQLKGGSTYDYGHREYQCEGFANWDRSSYVFTEEGGDDIILGGLLDDLGWEFVGEHHRRQDLIRFRMQDGRNVFNGKSWFCKDATTETHWDYFPIPKSALDANLNLKQNEGYSSK